MILPPEAFSRSQSPRSPRIFSVEVRPGSGRPAHVLDDRLDVVVDADPGQDCLQRHVFVDNVADQVQTLIEQRLGIICGSADHRQHRFEQLGDRFRHGGDHLVDEPRDVQLDVVEHEAQVVEVLAIAGTVLLEELRQIRLGIELDVEVDHRAAPG